MRKTDVFPPELRTDFERRFGGPPEVAAQAPGRVNLIGEHTDYSGGLVLPCAIDRTTRVLARRRSQNAAEGPLIRVWASDLGETTEFMPADLRAGGGWADYVKGVVASLAQAGHPVAAVDLAIASDLPREAGLSSSAALGVSIAMALERAFELELGPLEIARIVHHSENQFVGTGCGILDQFASALSREGHALRIDCRTQEVEAIAMPGDRLALLVAHSGITRQLARGDYQTRVTECAEATERLRDSGILRGDEAMLRELADSDLPGIEASLPTDLFRRVRHVVTENRRVDQVCQALVAGNLESVGQVLCEGHRSLRDDFEVSTPELDALCDVADALPGVHGSRLTGAGFGGCTVHLVDAPAAEEVSTRLRQGFEARMGYEVPVWVVNPAAGAGALDAF